MVRFLSATLAVVLMASVGAVMAADDSKKSDKVFAKTENGTPKIESIDAIAFGPNGALFIGDSKIGQVVAIDSKDTKAKAWKAKAIEKFDEKVAEKLGTTANKIEFRGMAVNRASGTVYVIVKNAGKSIIITVDGDGKIGEVALDKIDHVVIPLPKGTTQVTDIAYAGDRILVGGLSNEKFKAKVHSIPTPLDPANKATSFSTETYHVAHGKWETHAPMTTLIPYEAKGKKYVVGAFMCTPIVRYDLDDVKQDAKVKGNSVIELGNGNMPVTMFAYKKGDKSYLLVNNVRRFGKQFGSSKYWVARVDMSLFDETEKVNEKAQWRVNRKTLEPITDKVKMIDDYAGAAFMDQLDDKQAILIKEDGKSFTFTALELP